MVAIRPTETTIVNETKCAACGEDFFIYTRVLIEDWSNLRTNRYTPPPEGVAEQQNGKAVILNAKILGVAVNHDCMGSDDGQSG